MNDLALFFLKYIYQIPTNNWMVLFRTFLVGFLCVNASKEYYRFVSEKEREIKINCFMVNMIVFTEWFIVYKHGASKIFILIKMTLIMLLLVLWAKYSYGVYLQFLWSFS